MGLLGDTAREDFAFAVVQIINLHIENTQDPNLLKTLKAIRKAIVDLLPYIPDWAASFYHDKT